MTTPQTDAGTSAILRQFLTQMSGFDYEAAAPRPQRIAPAGPVSAVNEPLIDGAAAAGSAAELGAGLTLQLGRIADGLEAQHAHQMRRRRALAEIAHQRPIGPQQIPLTGGAGVLDLPDILGAKDGYFMSLRRITAYSFTAGSVVMYEDFVADMNVAVPWATNTPATFTFGRGEQLLMPGSRWVFAATGITGQVTLNGKADIGPLDALPDYLGFSSY